MVSYIIEDYEIGQLETPMSHKFVTFGSECVKGLMNYSQGYIPIKN